MIQKLLLNTRIIWKISIKILKNTIQIRNGKFYFDEKNFYFDEMIADMDNNEKLNKIVNELFVRGRKLNIFIVLIKHK